MQRKVAKCLLDCDHKVWADNLLLRHETDDIKRCIGTNFQHITRHTIH
jgi:hypothetical protein